MWNGNFNILSIYSDINLPPLSPNVNYCRAAITGYFLIIFTELSRELIDSTGDFIHSRHQDYAEVGNAITKAQMEEDMSLIKDIGANSIRLAHYQHNDYFYTLCDRAGMLVWAEIPFNSVPSTKDLENQNAKDQQEKLIKQAFNHSSIYCWGVHHLF